jgi:uncharacterized protein
MPKDPATWIARTADHVRQQMAGDPTGHDWFHIERVRRMALHIARAEGADLLIVELAALLHDLDDWKRTGAAPGTSVQARTWLEAQHVPAPLIEHICRILQELSFQGADVPTPMSSVEGACVQDADRLDALGAIGIARAFAYGGHHGRLLYDPDQPPQRHATFEAYRRSRGPTLNHFHEKLLLLAERMQTATGRRLAQARHRFLEQFLEQFLAEWEGRL